MRNSYPSDISRDQFEVIKPLLESARGKTSLRRVDMYEVFCTVQYLLRSGCQWRMLPEEFPKWRTVRSYFAIRSEPRETGAQRLQHALDSRRSRNVKNADTAGLKGY